jgi:hypothetical protein
MSSIADWLTQVLEGKAQAQPTGLSDEQRCLIRETYFAVERCLNDFLGEHEDVELAGEEDFDLLSIAPCKGNSQ